MPYSFDKFQFLRGIENSFHEVTHIPHPHSTLFLHTAGMALVSTSDCFLEASICSSKVGYYVLSSKLLSQFPILKLKGCASFFNGKLRHYFDQLKIEIVKAEKMMHVPCTLNVSIFIRSGFKMKVTFSKLLKPDHSQCASNKNLLELSPK